MKTKQWKKAAALMSAGAMTASVFAAPLAVKADDKVTISFSFDQGVGEATQKMVDAYNESQDKVEVQTVILPQDANTVHDDFVNKLASGDTSVDVMGLDVTYISEFGSAGWLADLTDLVDPSLTEGMLTGPVTILNWSFPREDISIRESIAQIALAIRDEVLDLEANGIQVIQIDEAALREKLPLRKSDWYTEYLDFAISAFRLTHSGVKPETQIHTHMCYSEFTDIIAAIDDMDADVITFEASRSDLQILDSLRENHFETEVGPGVYDIHSPRVPSVEEIVNALHIMLTKIEKDKLWVNPDCGLKTRGTKETEASLRNMVKAAKEIRKQA